MLNDRRTINVGGGKVVYNNNSLKRPKSVFSFVQRKYYEMNFKAQTSSHVLFAKRFWKSKDV